MMANCGKESKRDEARSLLRKAYNSLHKRYGWQDARTLMAADSLTSAILLQGSSLEEANAPAFSSFIARMEIEGKNHPYTKACGIQLINLMRLQDKSKEADELQQLLDNDGPEITPKQTKPNYDRVAGRRQFEAWMGVTLRIIINDEVGTLLIFSKAIKGMLYALGLFARGDKVANGMLW